MQKKQKNKPIVWSEYAIRDLENIYDYISSNFSSEVADKKIDLIFGEVSTLSQFPRKGKISTRFNEIRELTVELNTVYYRNNEADIVIATIRARRTKGLL